MSVDIYSSSPTDGLESEETQLLNLINEYRAQNGLPPIPPSKALTTVANRHAIDLAENIGQVTHAWSDAVYDSNNPNTWSAMWSAPQRFNTGYPGNGYENTVGYNGFDTPDLTAETALNQWKNSPLHNAVILNRGQWTDKQWNALGVGLYEGYGTLWFGEEIDPTGEPIRTGSDSAPPTLVPPSLPPTTIPNPPTLVPPSLPSVSIPNSPTPQPIDPLTGEVHRFWDESTQSHFFTASQAEFSDRLNNPSQYRYEGVEFETPSSNDSNAQPVYRYENEITGTYFYTLQSPDQITSNFPVLESDGIAFYAFAPDSSLPANSVPIHRFYNEGTSQQTGTPVHFFTGTESNKQNVIDNFPTFTYEGPGWYAFPVDL
ncbi:MAG: CAP domain-containing protein [Microcoleaceae cyanobacterium]